MANIFSKIGAYAPRRSLFNLSYEKKLSCDMGQLIPIMCDEVVPGDIFSIRNEVVVRMQPLVAPVLHEINVYTHYFFVPYRLLWDDWENFITGGQDGNYTVNVPTTLSDSDDVTTGSLWDYFGFPMQSNIQLSSFPFRAYNLVYNEYYRDENLQQEVDLDDKTLLHRCWEKDYFTSSLPWQQRGTAPSLPITGTIETQALWTDDVFGTSSGSTVYIQKTGLNKNKVDVDLSEASSFNISDLRLAFNVQKWLERNARGGARYTEQLRAHFGVSPKDERLQRPEYIGGSKSSIIVSEVLQTSETADTPQGTLAGHGISADTTKIRKYRATEFGCIIGIMSIMPRLGYNSQGIDRQWLRTNKYDYYFPEFQNLSEQAIYKAEIYATPNNTQGIFQGSISQNETDITLRQNDYFGFQGRYDELRTKNNLICGEFRNELSYWHLNRNFENAPSLNSDFVTCNPSKRIFAVQNRDGFLVSYANIIKALRPIVSQSIPGGI